MYVGQEIKKKENLIILNHILCINIGLKITRLDREIELEISELKPLAISW